MIFSTIKHLSGQPTHSFIMMKIHWKLSREKWIGRNCFLFRFKTLLLFIVLVINWSMHRVEMAMAMAENKNSFILSRFFFPIIELKWCSCNRPTATQTILLQSAQFETENGKRWLSSYICRIWQRTEKGTKASTKQTERKVKWKRKKISPQMKLNCVCFIIFSFYCY